jgi:hypothetical protein
MKRGCSSQFLERYFKVTTSPRTTLLIAVCLLAVSVPPSTEARGARVTVIQLTGQNVGGELLVVTGQGVLVKTESRIYNARLEEDSTFVLWLRSSDIGTIVVEGSSKVLLGMGIGLVVGVGTGALAAQRGWENAGALVFGLAGTLVGAGIGALASSGTKVVSRADSEGFASLVEYARYGAVTPKALEHLK